MFHIHEDASVGGSSHCHFGHLSTYNRVPDLDNLNPNNDLARRFGYLRLVLNHDFLQSRYNMIRNMINDAMLLREERSYLEDLQVDLEYPVSYRPDHFANWRESIEYWQNNPPNAPYLPRIGDLSIDYISRETVEVNMDGGDFSNPDIKRATIDDLAAKYENRVEQFFHIHPEGHAEVFPVADLDAETDLNQVYVTDQLKEISFSTAPLPDLATYNFLERRLQDGALVQSQEIAGELYIGIANFKLPQVLTLLFQFEEGSGNPEFGIPDVEWSYLEYNKWHTFSRSSINFDDTIGMAQSGIVSLNLPKIDLASNTIFTPGLVWLKITAIENADNLVDAMDSLMSIRAQAVTLSFADNDNDPNFLATPLPEGTLEGFADTDFQVVTSIQENPSFGGRVREEGEAYYKRVSERLRHKQRAITSWDVERLLLENFPFLDKVRCINHANAAAVYEPNRFLAAVVPSLGNGRYTNRFQPRVSAAKLEAMERYLQNIVTPTVTIHVRNPDYEEVIIGIEVFYRTGFDSTFYDNQFNEDLQRFISPFAFGDSDEVNFLFTLTESQVIAFAEGLEYVDGVRNVVMYSEAYPNGTTIMEPSKHSAVLVSALQHNINSLVTSTNC